MSLKSVWNYRICFRPWRTLLTGLIGFGGIAGVWVLWMNDQTEWPAWIQAIGSLIGIAIAIWLPWVESKRKRMEDRAKDQAYARRLFYAAYEICGQVAGLFNELQLIRNYDRESTKAIFERILARLNGPFDDDPHPERVMLVHELRQNMPGLLGYLNSGASDENEGGAHIFKLKQYYQGVCNSCWDHLAAVEADLPGAHKTKRPVDF